MLPLAAAGPSCCWDWWVAFCFGFYFLLPFHLLLVLPIFPFGFPNSSNIVGIPFHGPSLLSSGVVSGSGVSHTTRCWLLSRRLSLVDGYVHVAPVEGMICGGWRIEWLVDSWIGSGNHSGWFSE
ncbi:unnamed protein product [Malus baccata var. baccata]